MFSARQCTASAFALTATLMLGACSTNNAGAESAEETITLRLGHTLTTSSPYHHYAEVFAEEVNSATDGRVKVDLYPSSQLGGEAEMLTAVRGGDQDIFIAAQATLEDTVPEWKIFSMPYLFDGIDHANAVLQGDTGSKYLSMLDEHGLKGLSWLSAIERDVFATEPIDFPHLDGFKVRLMQSQGYITAYESLNATPTPMAYSELYVSLQQGVVDGGDTSPDQFVSDKFAEVAPYFYLSKMHYLPAVAIMGQPTWDRIPEELHDEVLEAARAASESEIDFYADAYAEGLQKAEEMGVEIIEVDLEAGRKATEPARQELLERVPEGEALYEEIVNTK